MLMFLPDTWNVAQGMTWHARPHRENQASRRYHAIGGLLEYLFLSCVLMGRKASTREMQ